jgi:hypothetical protein
MKILHYILFAIILFSACTKRIDIEPKEGDQKVVIQGFLFNDSTCKVVVSKSTGFLSKNKPPRISTATITLADDAGNSESLIYDPIKELYESTTIVGVINRTYTLTVVLDGETFTSVSLLPDLYKADSISPFFNAATIFQEEGWTVRFYGEDDPSKQDYYYIKGYANDSLLNSKTDIYVSDDKFLANNVNGIDLQFAYKSGDLARIDFFSITREAFLFYNAASLQLNSDGGFFSTPPANAPSNFNNGAVGLFQCSTLKPLITQIPN